MKLSFKCPNCGRVLETGTYPEGYWKTEEEASKALSDAATKCSCGWRKP